MGQEVDPGSGIHTLFCPEVEPTVDIVAVHGLNGGAKSTWTSETGNVCWLSNKNFLPRYVKSARILLFGYNANITDFSGPTSSDRILQHAYTLVADLSADRRLENAAERPIIFFCHSLGGIIVKRALAYSNDQQGQKVAHLQSICTCTYGILFFGTPHAGSDKAKLLGFLQKLTSSLPKKVMQTESNLVKALEPGSEILQNINDQFSSLIDRFCISFYWEEQRTDLKYTKDYIVDQDSAAPILGNTERSGISADHRGMCKFEDASSSSFRKVAATAMRYVEDAPNVVKTRIEKASEQNDLRRYGEARELLQRPRNSPLLLFQDITLDKFRG